MSERELFLAQLYTQKPAGADAIVCLCGQDAETRCDTARELLKLRAAPRIILSGGVEGPGSADAMAQRLLGDGVAPSALVLETLSQNTAEQARAVLASALGRLLLVASAYHLPRAFLTFLAVAGETRILPVPANAPWHECPPGLDRTRAELWHVELTKITQYQATGDCASWEDGLAYLKAWEGK